MPQSGEAVSKLVYSLYTITLYGFGAGGVDGVEEVACPAHEVGRHRCRVPPLLLLLLLLLGHTALAACADTANTNYESQARIENIQIYIWIRAKHI